VGRASLAETRRRGGSRVLGALVETVLIVIPWVAAVLGAAAVCYLWVLAAVGLCPRLRSAAEIVTVEQRVTLPWANQSG
jgi:hypothetical protein